MIFPMFFISVFLDVIIFWICFQKLLTDPNIFILFYFILFYFWAVSENVDQINLRGLFHCNHSHRPYFFFFFFRSDQRLRGLFHRNYSHRPSFFSFFQIWSTSSRSFYHNFSPIQTQRIPSTVKLLVASPPFPPPPLPTPPPSHLPSPPLCLTIHTYTCSELMPIYTRTCANSHAVYTSYTPIYMRVYSTGYVSTNVLYTLVASQHNINKRRRSTNILYTLSLHLCRCDATVYAHCTAT